MRTIVKGKNAEVPDRVREYAERKLKRIERLLDDQTDATVELWSEHHKSAADTHLAEVTLIIHGQRLRSRATGATYEAAHRRGRRQGRAPGGRPQGEAAPAGAARRRRSRSSAASPTAPRARVAKPRIVKTKRFAIEPMFEEDAVAAMEELGHQFFVFVNAETERVAILYRRDDGDYGLIEPVVGGDYTQGRSHAPERAGARRVRVAASVQPARAWPDRRTSYDAADASRWPTPWRPPPARQRHGQGRRSRPRDRRQRAPGLRRQPDRVAPSPAAAGGAAGVPDPPDELRHRAGRGPCLVPRQPRRGRGGLLRSLRGGPRQRPAGRAGFRGAVRQRPHRVAPRARASRPARSAWPMASRSPWPRSTTRRTRR